MKVAPIDIAHKTFDRKLNGIDPHQVYEFLKDVADQMEEVIRERNLFKDQLRERELQILEYRERDETLKATITTATRMTEQMKIEADKESALIIQDARQRSEIMTREARDSLKRCYQDINDLKRLRMQFETNLRSVIQAHGSMLEQGRTMMKDPTLPDQDQNLQQRAVDASNSIAQQNNGQNGSQNTHQSSNQVSHQNLNQNSGQNVAFGSANFSSPLTQSSNQPTNQSPNQSQQNRGGQASNTQFIEEARIHQGLARNTLYDAKS